MISEGTRLSITLLDLLVIEQALPLENSHSHTFSYLYESPLLIVLAFFLTFPLFHLYNFVSSCILLFSEISKLQQYPPRIFKAKSVLPVARTCVHLIV